MKKMVTVTPETLNKIIEVFSDNAEYTEFIITLMSLCNEISFAQAIFQRTTGDEAGIALAKVMVMFSSFCRMNMEVVQQLVRAVEFEIVEVTDDNSSL